jgi:hypothetical protein
MSFSRWGIKSLASVLKRIGMSTYERCLTAGSSYFLYPKLALRALPEERHGRPIQPVGNGVSSLALLHGLRDGAAKGRPSSARHDGGGHHLRPGRGNGRNGSGRPQRHARRASVLLAPDRRLSRRAERQRPCRGWSGLAPAAWLTAKGGPSGRRPGREGSVPGGTGREAERERRDRQAADGDS